MKFKIWLESNLPSVFIGVKSKDELFATLKRNYSVHKQEILDWLENINFQNYCRLVGTDHPVILYHGSPQDAIAEKGFQITNGQRAGMFGGTRSVQNQGIFMTDSQEMAKFFGSSRTEYGRNYNLYQAYANLDRILDMTISLPTQVRKLGLQLINSYKGKKKSKIAESEIWLLLDMPEFVDFLKSLGYDVVKFKESFSTRKQSDKNAFSYLIFDPNNLVIKSAKNDLLSDFDSICKYLNI